MILHFEDTDGERLNVNFDKHIYNDIKYRVFFTVSVSKIDMYQIMEELDFNCFAYDKQDATITPETSEKVPQEKEGARISDTTGRNRHAAGDH